MDTEEARRHGERWRPYRSVAAWSRRRAVEQAQHRRVQPKVT